VDLKAVFVECEFFFVNPDVMDSCGMDLVSVISRGIVVVQIYIRRLIGENFVETELGFHTCDGLRSSLGR
jgi:hypothetical protein